MKGFLRVWKNTGRGMLLWVRSKRNLLIFWISLIKCITGALRMLFRRYSTNRCSKRLFTLGTGWQKPNKPRSTSHHKSKQSSTHQSSKQLRFKWNKNCSNSHSATQLQTASWSKRTESLDNLQRKSTNSGKSSNNKCWYKSCQTTSSAKWWKSLTTNSYRTRRSWCTARTKGTSCVGMWVRRCWMSWWGRLSESCWGFRRWDWRRRWCWRRASRRCFWRRMRRWRRTIIFDISL